MNNFIKVVDEDGKEFEVEVIDIFNVDGYDDKDYILYTRNREIDENNIEVFVSIIKKDGEHYSLENIEDDTEWETVQKAMDEMGDV